MSTSYSIVVTTYSKEETGSRIIDALLSATLAACVQVVPIRSFYTWKGKVLKDREKLMLIKARSGDFGKIRATILGNHDYELPEIISVRIDRGLAGSLRWIDGVPRRAGSRRHRMARPGKVLP